MIVYRGKSDMILFTVRILIARHDLKISEPAEMTLRGAAPQKPAVRFVSNSDTCVQISRSLSLLFLLCRHKVAAHTDMMK